MYLFIKKLLTVAIILNFLPLDIMVKVDAKIPSLPGP